MSRSYIGLDVGFAKSKVWTDSTRLTTASAVAPAREIIRLAAPDTPDIIVTDEDGRRWFAGDIAVRQAEQPLWSRIAARDTDAVFRLMFRALLAYAVPAEAESDVHLVTGLPINEYLYAKPALERWLEQHRDITVRLEADGHDAGMRHIHMAQFRVLPQPYGTLADMVLDDEGRTVQQRISTAGERADLSLADDLNRAHKVVVDFGGETVDVLTLEGGAIRRELSTTWRGSANSVYALISRRFGSIPPFAIERRYLGGSLPGGMVLAIEEEFATLARTTAAQLRSLLDPAGFEPVYIILTGGPAAVVEQPFAQAIEEAGLTCTLLVKDGESNVRGFHKAARMLWPASPADSGPASTTT